MSKLTPENEKLLRSYKNITKALSLSPNSREYFEFKKMMSEEELTVLRHLKKEVSQQNHLTNKINGTVSATNRGRKKAKEAEAARMEPMTTTEPLTLEASSNTATSEATTEPPTLPSTAMTTESCLTVDQPVDNQLPKEV